MCRRKEPHRLRNCHILQKKRYKLNKHTRELEHKRTLVETKLLGSSRKVCSESNRKLAGKQKECNLVSTTLKETATEVLRVTTGKFGKKEETRWWCKKYRTLLRGREKDKKARDLNRNAEPLEAYKKACKEAKFEMAKANTAGYEELYRSLESEDGQQKSIQMAKQGNKNSQDVYQAKIMKDCNGKPVTDETKI